MRLPADPTTVETARARLRVIQGHRADARLAAARARTVLAEREWAAALTAALACAAGGRLCDIDLVDVETACAGLRIARGVERIEERR